ncbi:MAG: two-component sensor histidine kinase, partial [Acetobacteraceae bacterium]
MIEPGLFRSAGFRFGLVYAVLMTISAAALAMFLWWFTAGLLDRQTASAIRADAQGLIERFDEEGDEGGIKALVSTIEDRLAADVDDEAIYLLVDANMHRVAGNLDTWPSIVDTPGEWRQLQVRRGGMRS